MYLIRHGQSEGNIPNYYGLDTPLTSKGKEQARELAKKLQAIQFDAIISSPLIRAKQTAEILALERNLVVNIKQFLKEKYYGKYEDRIASEVKKELKELFEKRRTLPFNEWKKFRLAEDAESDEEAITRFTRELREIAIAYLNKTVLIVTHIGTMKLLLIELGLATHKELEGQSIPNTGFIKLVSDGVDFFVKDVVGLQKGIR